MKRLALPGLACALTFAVVGCGPMTSPMPARFDAEAQKKIDDGWDRAFERSGKLDRQELLDVMVGLQAYQLGVDTFHLKATKKFAGGTVVMEVTFDRAKPDDDRFEVSVYDAAGKLVRKERYNRKEVEETYNALFVNPPPPRDPAVADTPEVAARRAAHEARWNKIWSVFPEQKEGQQPAPAPRPRA
jgi:hypothetical protein